MWHSNLSGKFVCQSVENDILQLIVFYCRLLCVQFLLTFTNNGASNLKVNWISTWYQVVNILVLALWIHKTDLPVGKTM